MEVLVGLVLLVGLVWMSGAGKWVADATAFVRQEASGESRRLLYLQSRLAVLRWLAKEIGKTEDDLK